MKLTKEHKEAISKGLRDYNASPMKYLKKYLRKVAGKNNVWREKKHGVSE